MSMDFDKLDSMNDDDFINAIENIDNYIDNDIEDDNEVEETTEENEDNQYEPDDFESTGSNDNDDIETEDNAQDSEEETQEDDSDNEENTSDNNQTVDYRAEYERILEEKQRYEDFYNQATSEFVANGRKVKGFTDPKKIIEAQQMAAGFSEKMAGFKQYRPYINALKEKGILDHPERFNLAMNLLDGDKEAIKKQIKDLDIDPYELDMDNINYVQKNNLQSKTELALNDLVEQANESGVGKEITNILVKEWDDSSILEVIDDPKTGSDLINHMQTGIYDIVQERIMKKKMTDVRGTFGSQSSIQQYREAASELDREYRDYVDLYYEEKKADIEQRRQESRNQNISHEQKANYTKKVLEKQASQDDARRKAASLSGGKRNASQTKKKIDPLSDFNDDQFSDYIDSIMYQ